MIHKHVHMQDQVTNRIQEIMQEDKFRLWYQLEEMSVMILLVALFVVSVGV
jgi:hypothetical protein